MPHQRRIERLIAAMTLEEKIGQLGAFADALRPFAFEVNPETFARDAEQVREQIRSGRVGALPMSKLLAPIANARPTTVNRSPETKSFWLASFTDVSSLMRNRRIVAVPAHTGHVGYTYDAVRPRLTNDRRVASCVQPRRSMPPGRPALPCARNRWP